MVKTNETFWPAKIAEFKGQRNRSATECSSFLLDILQGLYEDIPESIKVELLLILQEHGESLIQGQELAEHAVGSIKSILDDLLTRHHGRLFVVNCLITTTTLIIQFDLDQFNPQLVQDVTSIFLGICKRVNAQGETLIRKVSCECLLELENAIPLSLVKYVHVLFDLARQERSFVAQSYMLLLGTTICNLLQNSAVETEELAYGSGFDGKPLKITRRDVQQMASFLAGEMNHMSTVIMWQIGQKVSFLFTNLQMPMVVLQNKMIQCCYSSDLQVLHLGLLLGLGCLQGSITFQDLNVVTKCLLRIIGMPVFPNGIIALCLDWLHEIIKQVDFMDDTQSIVKDASQEITRTLIFDNVNIMRVKFDALASFLLIHPLAYSYLNCLKVPMNFANHGLTGSNLSLLYRAFYLRFSQSDNSHEKENIGEHIVEITLKNPRFIRHTIDFIMAVKHDTASGIRKNIIHKIASFILKLSEEEFVIDSNNFFLLIELSCSENGLWPLGVIKWMRSLCLKSSINKNCVINFDWKFGSDILLICRAILATHGSLLLLQELADLLWLIHKHYQDQDVRDRALFFYMIIGHASPKYYEKLLVRSDTDKSMSRKTEMEIPADLVQGVLPTLRLDRKCVILEIRVNHKVQRVTGFKENLYEDVETYKMMLQKDFDKSIDLQLKIKLAAEMANEAKVYALKIKFDTNGRCKDIPNVLLPYLCNETQSHPEKQLFHLKFQPWNSVPFSILVSCTFTNEQGRICVAPVEPLRLNFADFFHPFILAADDEDESTGRKVLFDHLWQHFSRNQKTLKSKDNTCALSVKLLQITEERFHCIFERELKQFCIENTRNGWKVGIILLPAYHLLMDFEISKEETLVRICLDNWKFLDIVEDFLDEITSVT